MTFIHGLTQIIWCMHWYKTHNPVWWNLRETLWTDCILSPVQTMFIYVAYRLYTYTATQVQDPYELWTSLDPTHRYGLITNSSDLASLSGNGTEKCTTLMWSSVIHSFHIKKKCRSMSIVAVYLRGCACAIKWYCSRLVGRLGKQRLNSFRPRPPKKNSKHLNFYE